MQHVVGIMVYTRRARRTRRVGGINTSDPTLPNIDTLPLLLPTRPLPSSSSPSHSPSAMCLVAGQVEAGQPTNGWAAVMCGNEESSRMPQPWKPRWRITTTPLIVRQRRGRGGELGAVFCRCRSVVKPRHSALIVTLAGNRWRPRVASSGHLSDGRIHHGVNAEYAAKYDRPR